LGLQIAIAAIPEIKHKGEGIMNTGNFNILQLKYNNTAGTRYKEYKCEVTGFELMCEMAVQ
jgi:hypothetical protein